MGKSLALFRYSIFVVDSFCLFLTFGISDEKKMFAAMTKNVFNALYIRIADLTHLWAKCICMHFNLKRIKEFKILYFIMLRKIYLCAFIIFRVIASAVVFFRVWVRTYSHISLASFFFFIAAVFSDTNPNLFRIECFFHGFIEIKNSTIVWNTKFVLFYPVCRRRVAKQNNVCNNKTIYWATDIWLYWMISVRTLTRYGKNINSWIWTKKTNFL